jgi:hypothetical protein
MAAVTSPLLLAQARAELVGDFAGNSGPRTCPATDWASRLTRSIRAVALDDALGRASIPYAQLTIPPTHRLLGA